MRKSQIPPWHLRGVRIRICQQLAHLALMLWTFHLQSPYSWIRKPNLSSRLSRFRKIIRKMRAILPDNCRTIWRIFGSRNLIHSTRNESLFTSIKESLSKRRRINWESHLIRTLQLTCCQMSMYQDSTRLAKNLSI
jgi:hypothetical protein